MDCAGKTSLEELTTQDVEDFFFEKRIRGIKPETYNHYHSAILFVYKRILKMRWDEDDIPRMKNDRYLPTVLTKGEIQLILDATKNLKHKAMLATMYSAGLRVSELTHLHYSDISRTHRHIHVRGSKSRTDRYTLLADRTLDLLTEYWFKCGKPMDILFPSSYTGGYLDKNSVNQFLKKSAKKAGIEKHVTTHRPPYSEKQETVLSTVKQVHTESMPVSVRTAEAFSSTTIHAGTGTVRCVRRFRKKSG